MVDLAAVDETPQRSTSTSRLQTGQGHTMSETGVTACETRNTQAGGTGLALLLACYLKFGLDVLFLVFIKDDK